MRKITLENIWNLARNNNHEIPGVVIVVSDNSHSLAHITRHCGVGRPDAHVLKE
jgi:hypothetical protein